MPSAGTIDGLDRSARAVPEGFPGAAAVVHDLGNLIQIAASAVSIISRNPRAGRDPALEPILSRARTALERASDLVRQSRRLTLGPAQTLRATAQPQCFASCLDEIRALLAWICEPALSLTIDLEPDLPRVSCSRIQLQNAVLNLVINARDATPDGGSVEIIARRVTEGSIADTLEFSVADNGVGMSPEALARAFNPYFTTKADGRGTGLGLSIVRRFAEEAGGSVDIASSRGEGTSVTLRLPHAGMVHEGV